VSRFSRQKGKRGERAVASDLRAAFPELAEEIRRGWQTRNGGDEPDVFFPGYWIEVKNEKRPRPIAALQQAKKAMGEAKLIPLAVVRQTGQAVVAVLYWEDCLK